MVEEIIINHQSQSSGKIYKVNISRMTCDCPDFRIRQAKINGLCKHLRIEIEKMTGEKLNYNEIIKKNPDVILFVEQYGEETLDMLKKQGICFEDRGVLKLLE